MNLLGDLHSGFGFGIVYDAVLCRGVFQGIDEFDFIPEVRQKKDAGRKVEGGMAWGGLHLCDYLSAAAFCDRKDVWICGDRRTYFCNTAGILCFFGLSDLGVPAVCVRISVSGGLCNGFISDGSQSETIILMPDVYHWHGRFLLKLLYHFYGFFSGTVVCYQHFVGEC